MLDGNALRQVRTRELPFRRMQLWLKMARGTYDERGRMCWMIARCRPRSHVCLPGILRPSHLESLDCQVEFYVASLATPRHATCGETRSAKGLIVIFLFARDNCTLFAPNRCSGRSFCARSVAIRMLERVLPLHYHWASTPYHG